MRSPITHKALFWSPVEQMIIVLLWGLTSGVADYEHQLLVMRKLIFFYLVQQGMISWNT